MKYFKKIIKFILTSLKSHLIFLVLIGLISTGLLISFASLRPLMQDFLLLSFTPSKILIYLIGYLTTTTSLTIYFYFSNFRDAEEIGRGFAHSAVVSILLVSSIRFSGYFITNKIYRDFIQFFTSLTVLSPVAMLIFLFKNNLKRNDKISMLVKLGIVAENKLKIAKNTLTIFIAGLASLIIEKLIITKINSFQLYSLILVFGISLYIVAEIFNQYGEKHVREFIEKLEDLNSELNTNNPRS
ncbi:MAG: hypothetical protein ABEK16_02035 [Candidatus Nanohalobium sp.]